MRGGLALLCLAVSAAGCAARPSTYSFVGDGRVQNVEQLLATPTVARQNITVTELQRGDSSSMALVQVRDREQPHVHTRYDLTIVVARGQGTLWLNGTAVPMQRGDAAYIPKGTPHYFVNQGSEPATAVVVFSPPFSGPDQQQVK